MKLNSGSWWGSYNFFSIVHTCMWVGGCKVDFCFCSLLYGTKAPIAQCQQPEAWPTSIYGHLREWTVRMGTFRNHVPNNQCQNCIFSIILPLLSIRMYQATGFLIIVTFLWIWVIKQYYKCSYNFDCINSTGSYKSHIIWQRIVKQLLRLQISIKWAVALVEFTTGGLGCKLDFRFFLLYFTVTGNPCWGFLFY